jgi:histidine triad (HIT) family protein
MELYDSNALMSECIFCKVAHGQVPAKVVYRNEHVIAIKDVNPQAPTHLLVMPIGHFGTLWEAVCTQEADFLIRILFETASRLGMESGGTGGYRLVVNTGTDGGQTVGHVHVHVLAGRRMSWPPG